MARQNLLSSAGRDGDARGDTLRPRVVGRAGEAVRSGPALRQATSAVAERRPAPGARKIHVLPQLRRGPQHRWGLHPRLSRAALPEQHRTRRRRRAVSPDASAAFRHHRAHQARQDGRQPPTELDDRVWAPRAQGFYRLYRSAGPPKHLWRLLSTDAGVPDACAFRWNVRRQIGNSVRPGRHAAPQRGGALPRRDHSSPRRWRDGTLDVLSGLGLGGERPPRAGVEAQHRPQALGNQSLTRGFWRQDPRPRCEPARGEELQPHRGGERSRRAAPVPGELERVAAKGEVLRNGDVLAPLFPQPDRGRR
mmetsp:Transcript_22204/g.71976  ORF Transcript_22204/g.71976 Transcript_22204/m.71976 type:complete len:307 (+) Transcript_22204:1007-1927(+)